MGGLNFNPLPTTTAIGSFAVQSDGFIQGVIQDDPGLRYQITSGLITGGPMWGGLLISETTGPIVGSPPPQNAIGGTVSLATGLPGTANGDATGFTCFNQAHNLINWPQSPVPTGQPGMTINFARFGSNLRIPLAASPLLADLEGNVISQQVSWDYVAQMLVPYTPGFSVVTISDAVWASTDGGQTTFTVGTDLTADLNAGDLIEVQGVVSTGGSGAGFNGQWEVVSVTSTEVVVTQTASTSPGTYSSGGTIAAQGGALPVKVLKVQVGNSMTVSYNATTQLATWNRQGTCALVLL